jgi:ParB/RepB/Spo0J family partition protein
VESADKPQINVLPLDSLVVPETPIRLNAEIGVEELTESVGRDGLLEPLVVRPSKRGAGKYEVVCGLRRFTAAQKAGLKAVPCIVKEMGDVEAMEAMLIENMERENLTDYEMGRWFKLLMEKYPDKYPNVRVVAHRFGYKDHAQIVRLLSHYETVEQLKGVLPANILPRGKMLPERVVREIRRADPEYWAVLAKAYFKSVDDGMPLGVAGVAALVDVFSHSASFIER